MYNRWTNFETWLTALYTTDFYGHDIEEYDNVTELAEQIKYETEEWVFYETDKASLAFDLLRNSLAQVNWVEIAESIWEEYKNEEED